MCEESSGGLKLQEIKLRVDAAEDFMCSWLFSETASTLPEVDRSQIRQIIAMLANISELVSAADPLQPNHDREMVKGPIEGSKHYSAA